MATARRTSCQSAALARLDKFAPTYRQHKPPQSAPGSMFADDAMIEALCYRAIEEQADRFVLDAQHKSNGCALDEFMASLDDQLADIGSVHASTLADWREAYEGKTLSPEAMAELVKVECDISEPSKRLDVHSLVESVRTIVQRYTVAEETIADTVRDELAKAKRPAVEELAESWGDMRHDDIVAEALELFRMLPPTAVAALKDAARQA